MPPEKPLPRAAEAEPSRAEPASPSTSGSSGSDSGSTRWANEHAHAVEGAGRILHPSEIEGRGFGWSQGMWRRFCAFSTDVFYRDNEVAGLDHLPTEGPVILVANHVNALVDAMVVQASLPRPIHPIARSGLFRNPLLRPILRFIQAVPIHRRPKVEDGSASKTPAGDSNQDSFRQLYEYLGQDRVILIFPEGQSHSDPSLRPLKTGAARLALGHYERTGAFPAVVPVGLTFTHKGRFRADVLVQVGRSVRFEAREEESEEEAVRRHTEEILDGLRGVTLNAESWQDLSLMKLMQQFFALRSSRERRPSLALRFRSLQRLIESHRLLRNRFPEKVEILRVKLQRFQKLCRRHGVRNYQLELEYTPRVVLGFLVRSLAFLLFVFPLALWGLVSSAIPFFAATKASQLSARGRDQYDTAGILFGLVFFAAFWGAQTFAVWWWFGDIPALAYALSLPITTAVAMRVGHERKRILEEVRVYWLFSRRRELQKYLRTKRQELEIELARMARRAKQIRKAKQRPQPTGSGSSSDGPAKDGGPEWRPSSTLLPSDEPPLRTSEDFS